MSQNTNILTKAISFLGMALIVYIFLFITWFVLMLGCTGTHSISECRDNSLTDLVMIPFNLINN